MQIIYSIISILILLLTIDFVYFSYKKIVQYINKKKELNFVISIKARYPALFLIGGLTSVILYNKSNIFLEILKSSFLFGMLFVMVYLNVVVMKRILFRTKGNIQNIKKIEKGGIVNLFKKKK